MLDRHERVGQVVGSLELIVHPPVRGYDIAEHSQGAEEIWLGLIPGNLTEELSAPLVFSGLERV